MKVHNSYIDELLTDSDNLSQIQSYITSAKKFDSTAPLCGLERPLFAFMGVTDWLSSCIRIGAIQWHEATPCDYQDNLRGVIPDFFWDELTTHYVLGLDNSENEEICVRVDDWVSKNDSEIEAALLNLVSENRDMIYDITSI